MLKEERLQRIVKMLEQSDMIKVADIMKELQVADMTVRRDLQALEEAGLLVRLHGGATKAGYKERSNTEKQSLNQKEKKAIAKQAASLIHDHDTVFLGPGTTNESMHGYIQARDVKIVTTSLPIFMKFKGDPRFELLLAGGEYRERTGSFIGALARQLLGALRFNKAFIGTNGIHGSEVTAANEEEGEGHRIICHRTEQLYITADHSKFGVSAFYTFCHLQETTAVITDSMLDKNTLNQLKNHTQVFTAQMRE
ncbi:DeoR/GlpR family DNA-binding transcription regulator [Shouchella clausii]|jgi:DeoR family transcriptional regulator, lactose phosphotransferase system repressor|uniref:Lactose phosphotransferase system repressor n=3 Tax=Shouchella TaxID=2893057 RepID=Q5WD08_SHOC1|nr:MULTISPECIES: DeoR/GlpR family DNA-binding transcription regulator [Shouchella]ALA53889.1 Lactose phosphotransferase system repressor [Shouchella clausii]KKI87397.1 DeoR faimly transcriptional regulator [Shouchella clausii]MBU3229551.1 DeoR/GlpR family DNA-binding transcription regulator [Shouchella clausii]MBU3265226.1 DeoR/GlpR family DNA-binding transcription regulator [Shouchella clausii]MBU3506452.1 DeoR/GlpR family DNA-binding transcription regulator [Shouchella clausii]